MEDEKKRSSSVLDSANAIINRFADELRNNCYWSAYLSALEYQHHLDATDAGFKRMGRLALAFGIRKVLDYLHEDLNRLDVVETETNGSMPPFGDIAYVLNLLRVYMPGVSDRNEEPILNDPADFGGCPICGKNDGYLNIHKSHWFICHEHKKKWWHGFNLFSSWQWQTDDEWQENHDLLLGYEEVMPKYPDVPGSRKKLEIPKLCAECHQPFKEREPRFWSKRGISCFDCSEDCLLQQQIDDYYEQLECQDNLDHVDAERKE